MTSNIEDQAVSKTDVLGAIVTAATQYYQTITTVASAFLGGTLFFMEKIVPPGTRPQLLGILAAGWLLLIGAILSVVFVQRWNLVSGQLAMRGQIGEAQQIDRRSNRATLSAVVCLTSGIALVMLYGFLNLLSLGEKIR
jgi:hypothetical protein